MPVNLGSAFGEIRVGTKGIEKAEKQANKSFGSIERGLGSLKKTAKIAATAVAAAGAAATVALAKFVKGGISKAANLEAQLDGIQSIMGATDQQAQQLKEHILDLGMDPDLQVNSEQAAQAIETLARNGLKADEILNGAAKSSVLLANATKAQLGTAADIATDSMAIFNIKAEDMMGAVNGITSVVNNSKFGIEDYQLALAQGGGVAASVGVEFEDFNTAIAGISSRFNSGSDAGTSMKVMLQRLVPASNKASDKMRALGIITEEGNNRFFDAQGNMKDMSEIAGILQDSLGDLSEEQRSQALSVIFGTDAMRAAVGMAEMGEKGFKSLQDQMGETDAVEAAKDRMDNFKGALEVLDGIVETIQFRVGDQFLPILTDLARMFASKLSANADRIVGVFAVIADVISRAMNGSIGLTSIVLRLADAFGVSTSTAIAVIQALQSIRERVRGVIEQAQAILGPIVAMITRFVSWKDVLIAVGAVVAAAVLPALASIVTAAAVSAAAWGALIAIVAALRTAWQSDWQGIRTMTLRTWNEILKPALMSLANWLRVQIPLAIETLKGFWNSTLKPTLKAIWNFLQDPIFPTLLKFADWLRVTIPAAFQTLRNFWNSTLKPALMAIWNFLQDPVFPTLLKFADWLRVTIPAAFQTLRDFWNDTLKPAFEAIWSFINDDLIPVYEAWQEVIGALGDKIGEWVTFVWEAALKPALEALWKFIRDKVNPIVEDLTEWFDEKLTPAAENVDGILATVKETLGKLGDKIGGFIDDFLDPLEDGLQDVKDVLEDVKDFFGDLAEKIRNLPSPPDWAMPGSLPPLARGFLDIAGAAEQMAEAQALAMKLTGNVGGSGLGPAAVAEQAARNIDRSTNTTFNLTAQYQHRPRASLKEDVKMLRMLTQGA